MFPRAQDAIKLMFLFLLQEVAISQMKKKVQNVVISRCGFEFNKTFQVYFLTYHFDLIIIYVSATRIYYTTVTGPFE